ncbi:vanadium-dependent haloperoxidase [Thiosocius teredinicola]|uniref:vanadium-dependent haloperoxidase n=1 Tax=Thiosocius teredinicola TaxID=1973002 RepID=UPI000990B52D
MKLPYSEPDPAGSERARIARDMRALAADISRLRPQALTHANREEADHGPQYPANFTKGLLHDGCGLVKHPEDYRCFVEAINAPDPTLFEKHVESAQTRGVTYSCVTKTTCHGDQDVAWRGWESPRGGHVYELEGSDPGACGMAPAPRVGSSELAAEMAEVYALAILRDVPFTEICQGGDEKLCTSSDEQTKSLLSAAQLVDLLNDMPFYSGTDRTSSTPHNVDESGLNSYERNRRFARTQSADGALTPETAFRGSTKGALVGPYLSQFMLIGAKSLACAGGGAASYPGRDAPFDLQDGYIPYGSLIIDQRALSHKNCLDYMTDWCSWLDVQNGANLKGADLFEENRRFITTPRDLATYVHFDALYEAYLNACLLMLAMGVPASKGFPEPSPSGRRDAFATFGGPHILSLVTEVATRCLKAVRRQKFNYHRRARPETIAGRLALVCSKVHDKLGCSSQAFENTFKEIPSDLLKAIVEHNKDQNDNMAAMRNLDCTSKACAPDGVDPGDFADCNVLLPMAFPEGSPMHPAYGAGHATVAGGCVTMLKAFFEMFEDCDSHVERGLCDKDGKPIVYVPNADGSRLVKDSKFKGKLTIQGELDKLAANISIGRNMAGVHYYSDYYDSLRMGERIAVGILLEQAPTYGEAVETTFKSFDGDYITIYGEAGSCPALVVQDRYGNPVSPHDWWLRHVPGEELSEDL